MYIACEKITVEGIKPELGEARFFSTAVDLAVYLSTRYHDRMEKYARRRACGERWMPAFNKHFEEVITLFTDNTNVAYLGAEMDLSAAGLILSYIKRFEIRPSVGIFLDGEPVWTAADSERALLELLEKSKTRPVLARRKMERRIKAELSAIRGSLQ